MTGAKPSKSFVWLHGAERNDFTFLRQSIETNNSFKMLVITCKATCCPNLEVHKLNGAEFYGTRNSVSGNT